MTLLWVVFLGFFFWWVRHESCVWAECGCPLHWNSRSLSVNPSPRGIWQAAQQFPCSLCIQICAFGTRQMRTFLRLNTHQYPPNGGASLMVSFQPSTVFCKTSLTVIMPAQGEGASSSRLSSASVILVPTLTRGKAGENSSFFLLFINFICNQDWMESNTFSPPPPVTDTAKARNPNQDFFCCSCNTGFSTERNSAATLH